MTTVYNNTGHDFIVFDHTTNTKKTIKACKYETVDNFVNSTLDLMNGPKVKTTNSVSNIINEDKISQIKVKTNADCMKLSKDNCKDGCVWDKDKIEHMKFCSAAPILEGKYCDVHCNLKDFNRCEWSITCKDYKTPINSHGYVKGCTPPPTALEIFAEVFGSWIKSVNG